MALSDFRIHEKFCKTLALRSRCIRCSLTAIGSLDEWQHSYILRALEGSKHESVVLHDQYHQIRINCRKQRTHTYPLAAHVNTNLLCPPCNVAMPPKILRSPDDILDDVRTFAATHGRLPRKSAGNAAERKLGTQTSNIFSTLFHRTPQEHTSRSEATTYKMF